MLEKEICLNIIYIEPKILFWIQREFIMLWTCIFLQALQSKALIAKRNSEALQTLFFLYYKGIIG